MKNAEKNIHAGHRERLNELVANTGVDALSEVQAVEYFLTYIFPRGDVNPLAHRLLEEYESFSHIIDASAQDLMRVAGINKRSALKSQTLAKCFISIPLPKCARNLR